MRIFACGLCGFVPVDCAAILLMECPNFEHVSLLAGLRRFAPTGLASRVPQPAREVYVSNHGSLLEETSYHLRSIYDRITVNYIQFTIIYGKLR